eukprot:747356-Hanusia_phi.AAC.2
MKESRTIVTAPLCHRPSESPQFPLGCSRRTVCTHTIPSCGQLLHAANEKDSARDVPSCTIVPQSARPQ